MEASGSRILATLVETMSRIRLSVLPARAMIRVHSVLLSAFDLQVQGRKCLSAETAFIWVRLCLAAANLLHL
jgi:hypothetical protein